MPLPKFSRPPEDFYRKREMPRNRERDEQAMRRMESLNDLYSSQRPYGLGSWGYTGTRDPVLPLWIVPYLFCSCPDMLR